MTASATKNVLVTATNYSTLCVEGKKLFEDSGWTVIENSFGRPMTFAELQTRVGDIDAVVAGVDTWNEDVFRLAPRLKVISRFGVGVDNIDVEVARRFGIKVTNAGGINANAVAELTIGLLLSAMRAVPALYQSTRAGRWDRFVGEELIGRTVGLLGFGNIAQKVARKLSGFDVDVIAYDKYPNAEAAERLEVAMVAADELLRRADVVCLLLPSLKETHHFMDASRFALMKAGSYFVNTARGALVDEAALAQALESGRIRAAAIDVYEVEPVRADNPLLRMDTAVTTPHTAAETYEVYRAVGLETAQAILDAFAGRTPRNLL